MTSWNDSIPIGPMEMDRVVGNGDGKHHLPKSERMEWTLEIYEPFKISPGVIPKIRLGNNANIYLGKEPS